MGRKRRIKRRINRRFLEALGKGPGKPMFYRDSEQPGFGVKVTTKGKVNFFVEGRIKGSGSKRITVGEYPITKLIDARELARDKLAIMKQGFDPIELEKETHEAKAHDRAIQEALSVTLETVFENCLRARRHKPTTVRDYRNTFKNWFSDWLTEPIRSIKRQDIEERFYKITENARSSNSTNGIAQATKAMRYLSAVMNYAKAEEIEGERLITENPCTVLSEKKVYRKVNKRTRYLEKPDLALLLGELSKVRHTEYKTASKRITSVVIADYLVLLLFTGLRRNEAASLEWCNVNLDDSYFTIEDTKNGLTHVVPMSPPVKAMLQERFNDRSKHSKWVFPAKRGDGYLIEPRKQIEKITQITGVKFTSHDLRRTFATVADSYGLDHQLIKRSLNHKTQDITEGYIQTRVEKMRYVFDAIAEEIQLWAFDIPPESKLTEEEIKAISPPTQSGEDERGAVEGGYVTPQEAG